MRVARFVFAVAVVLVAHSALAQPVDPALTAAIAGRDKAAIDRDPAAMAKYTADDYASINPTGARMTKQQRVDGLKTPAAPGSTPGVPPRTEAIHMYGTNAAVARMKQAGNRQLMVWIKNPSGWQAAAIHVVPDTFLPPQAPLQDRPKTPQASTLMAPAGLSGERAAVFAAQKQIQDSFFSGDRPAYDKLTAAEHARLLPGLIRFGNENSTAFDGAPRPQPKYANITVQVWGQLGVVRWLETGPAGRPTWLTRVFAKNAAGWQQVATASSIAATVSHARR